MYYAKHLLLALIPGILFGLAGFSFIKETGLLDGKSPQSFKAYVITSGSMEPALPVGSVVISQTAESYKVGDIVTFTLGDKKDHHVTHRIVGMEGETITTKGDANEEADLGKISAEQITGKTLFSIPFVGKAVEFAKTPKGFVALIIIPATIVIYEELKTVLNEIKKVLKSIFKRGEARVGKSSRGYWRAAIALPLVGLAFVITISTAYFSDIEKSLGNILGIATTYGETSEPSPAFSNLVINEVYYDTGDLQQGENTEDEGQNEWIEIYNPNSSSVPIQDWQICDNNSCVAINPNVSVPANGFALVSRDASTWNFWTIPDSTEKIHSLGGTPLELSNSGDEVVLKDPDGNVIDAMSYGTNINQLNPSAVDVAEGHSLERDTDGHDTDQFTDFLDRSTPTPGS